MARPAAEISLSRLTRSLSAACLSPPLYLCSRSFPQLRYNRDFFSNKFRRASLLPLSRRSSLESAAPKKIGLIGLGLMGRPMGMNLLKAGHPLTVWNRTASRAEELLAAGAKLAKSPQEVAAASELLPPTL